MMAAYQPQPIHPGMNPHGHPGMPQNMQHMGQPTMPQGVSGPGQTQMSEMMGMPAMPSGQHPGGGGMPPNQGMGGQSMPGQNPQAMSHMTPQQMMQQQQIHQMQQNPQMIMQQHQQRIAQAQLMRMQAQAQANGMNGMMGMPQGGMQGITPQQMAMLQHQSNAGGQPGPVQLPSHLQQQQQQLMQNRALQQQQAQQNHQAQLQQQQLAMQHANSQQSNQGQPGPPNQQGQQVHPPQMRPQSRMANPNEQTPAPQQQHPQQGQQGHSQQGTPQQSQQPNQQPGQQPGMNPQQLQQMQQQQRMALVHRQQQQQQMQAQRMQQVQQQQAQAQAQQQQHQSGALVLRINLLCDHLSNFNLTNGKDLDQWNDFVDKHFAPEGRLLHSFDDNPGNKAVKTYEVLRPTIARYFFTYFDSGAQSLRLHIEHARENPLGNNRYQVSCSHATLAVSYPYGARLEMTGSLSALFAPASNIIECLELQQTGIEETLSRSEIERVLTNWSPVIENKSPKMAKNKLPKAQQKLQQRFDGLTMDHFPKAPKGTMGVTSRVQQFLELGETMNCMAELMHFSRDKKLRPEHALDIWAAQNDAQQGQPNQQGNPHINLPPNGVPMGNRTPSMSNMQMQPAQGNFSSPAMANMGLPMQNGPMNGGSPHIANNPGLAPNANMQPNSHTPSPHQSNMAAPPMLPQHSQQGTSSSAAGANTCPQVNNKRRRSTVKLEDDGTGQDAGPAPNQRVKPSPRMGKKGKPGGTG